MKLSCQRFFVLTRFKTPCLFSRKSFGDLSYWLDAVRLHSGIDTVVVVVRNKSDLDICRCISAEQGEAFAKTHGLPFAETSTARNEGTEEVFEEVALGAYDTMLARIERRKRDQTHTVHPFDLNNEARGACCSLLDRRWESRSLTSPLDASSAPTHP